MKGKQEGEVLLTIPGKPPRMSIWKDGNMISKGASVILPSKEPNPQAPEIKRADTNIVLNNK